MGVVTALTLRVFFFFFFPTDFKVQIRLRGCVGSYWYSLFSWGVVTALTLRCFFPIDSKVQIKLRMRRLIRIFAVLLGRGDSSHAAVLFSNRQLSPDQAADIIILIIFKLQKTLH